MVDTYYGVRWCERKRRLPNFEFSSPKFICSLLPRKTQLLYSLSAALSVCFSKACTVLNTPEQQLFDTLACLGHMQAKGGFDHATFE